MGAGAQVLPSTGVMGATARQASDQCTGGNTNLKGRTSKDTDRFKQRRDEIRSVPWKDFAGDVRSTVTPQKKVVV